MLQSSVCYFIENKKYLVVVIFGKSNAVTVSIAVVLIIGNIEKIMPDILVIGAVGFKLPSAVSLR